MFTSDSCKYACAYLRLTSQLPSGLFAEPPLDSGGVDDRDRPNWRANSEIEHHIFCLYQCQPLVPHLLSKLNVTARHWIVLRKENRGGGGGRGSYERPSVT